MANRYSVFTRMWGGPARVNFAPPAAPGGNVPAMYVTVPTANVTTAQLGAMASPIPSLAHYQPDQGLTRHAPDTVLRSEFYAVNPFPSNGQH